MATLAAAWLAALAGLAASTPAQRLAVVNPALHQFEDGPPLPAPPEYLTGETVFLSFQVSGYQATEQDRVRLSYQIETRDGEGRLLAPPASGKVEAELAEEDKGKWMPKIRYSVLAPPLGGSADCRIRIRVRDEVGGTEAGGEVPFSMRGRAVESSDTLVIRNFRFLRGEEDGQPLAVAAYRPGEALWARFDITGFKLGEKNACHVEYGITVLRATGEALYTEPEAASEQDQSFYPKRYIPGILSLNLDADIAHGEYAILVFVRDRIGSQQYETRQVFRIE